MHVKVRDVPMKNSNQYKLPIASLNCFAFAASSSSAQIGPLSTFPGKTKEILKLTLKETKLCSPFLQHVPNIQVKKEFITDRRAYVETLCQSCCQWVHYHPEPLQVLPTYGQDSLMAGKMEGCNNYMSLEDYYMAQPCLPRELQDHQFDTAYKTHFSIKPCWEKK